MNEGTFWAVKNSIIFKCCELNLKKTTEKGTLFLVSVFLCFFLVFSEGMPAAERAVLQEQLIDIILEVLKRNPQLHYYQGYHDVAVTLLLVVGERMTIALLDKLSNVHLRLAYFSQPLI